MSEYTSYDLVEWGEPFEKRYHELPKPTGVEVLIKVTAAGLCHSDLHIKKGYMDLGQEGQLRFTERGAKLPMTYGHEIAGIVEAVGDDVQTLNVASKFWFIPG
jgi:propanol-preferring alcohol dehydrogenase